MVSIQQVTKYIKHAIRSKLGSDCLCITQADDSTLYLCTLKPGTTAEVGETFRIDITRMERHPWEDELDASR